MTGWLYTRHAFSVAYANCAGFNYGYTVTLPNGGTLRRVVERDPHRRGLVTACRTYCNVSEVDAYVYAYDADGRPVSRNGDAFGYDDRDQVTYAAIGTNVFTHAYDEIGNHVLGGANAETNTFVANCLNQRVSVLGASAPPRELAYAADGGLANDGRFAYAYDAEDRLASVTSLALTNGAVRVRNEYDWRSRRVAKCVDRYDADAEEWRPAERHDFAWDNWNIVHETVSTFAVAATNVTEVQYFWGPDLSGTLDGAGGVGGLLAVSFNGSFYFPVYDNNGNVMKYVDESGDVVAEYVYDDFGRTISQSGGLVDSLTFGFSTKYLDRETGLVAYQLRCYLPPFRIWNNRDPAEEVGGENLYRACNNQLLSNVDVLGRNRYITQFDVLNYGGSGGTQLHVGVAVDRWKCQEGNWIKTGVTTFDFGLDSDQGWRNRVLAVAGKAKGAISQREGLHLQAPITLKSTPEQDIVMYNLIKKDIANPPFYNLIFHQCIFWSVGAVNYGM